MKRFVTMATIAASAALGAMGCAAMGSLTTPADYAAYRATRVGATFENRLSAAERYLAEHPNGVFRKEVQAYYDRAEPLFFQSKQDSVAGLDEYLRALPNGPHKVAATVALREQRATQLAKLGETSMTADDVEKRIGHAAAERFRVREEISLWVERFLDAGVWQAPLSQAKASLIIPWSLVLPAPRCTTIEPAKPGAKAEQGGGALRCAKLLELPYTVTIEGAASEARQATIEVVVIEDKFGKPLEAQVSGPDLFVRLEETFAVRAVKANDAERRAAAAQRAVELVRVVFAKAVAKDASCKRQHAAPAALELACKGVAVRVRPSAAAGEDDVITLSPE